MALFIAWALKVSITSPLIQLAHGMKEIQEGRLDTTIHNKRKDEFGLIISHFNEMAKSKSI
ncbi:HAMP domain-containing protein [Bacillus sp. N9]